MSRMCIFVRSSLFSVWPTSASCTPLWSVVTLSSDINIWEVDGFVTQAGEFTYQVEQKILCLSITVFLSPSHAVWDSSLLWEHVLGFGLWPTWQWQPLSETDAQIYAQTTNPTATGVFVTINETWLLNCLCASATVVAPSIHMTHSRHQPDQRLLRSFSFQLSLALSFHTCTSKVTRGNRCQSSSDSFGDTFNSCV